MYREKILKVTASSRQSAEHHTDKVAWRGMGIGREETIRVDESENQARSPHYFVQITHAAVICEIPVILHFKLENKTARLAVAYPLGGISMLSPPVTLTLLQASRARVL